MPIYEYECEKCSKHFEYMQSISEAPKKKCESCGGKLAKLISAAGFVLKGGGWYKDLYSSSKGDSSSSSSESANGSASVPKTSESSGEKKTESKPKAPESKPKAKKQSSKGR